MKKKSNEKRADQNNNNIRVLDGGFGWVVLFGSFFISFILDGVMYSFGMILDGIKQDLNVRDEIANLLSSFNTGLLFCSGPIVAGLSKQFGFRVVVMGGAIVTSFMYMLTSYSPNIYIMMATYGVVGGLSTGATYLGSLMIIPEYFDKKKGIANSIAMCGSGFGSFAIPPLIGWLLKNKDWQFTLSICACVIFQACIFGALLRPSNQNRKLKKAKVIIYKNVNKNEIQVSKDINEPNVIQTYIGSSVSLHKINQIEDEDKKLNATEIIIEILKEITNFKLLNQDFGFLLITISNLFIFTGYFAPFLYITKIAQDNGISKENASFLISIIGIVNIPARLFFGFISDKKIISAINLNTVSIVLSTISLISFFILKNAYWSLILFSVIFAIGIAGINSLTTPYLIELVGKEKFSNATGIISLFRGLGCFFGPFLAGGIAKRYGEVNAFFFSGFSFLIGLLLAILVNFIKVIKTKCIKSSDRNISSEQNKNYDNDPESDKRLLS